MNTEVALYLALSLVEKLGSVTAVRDHIEAKKAEGKTVDAILNELETERQEAASAAHHAVDRMP